MPVVREDLDLTTSQVGNIIIKSVSISSMQRILLLAVLQIMAHITFAQATNDSVSPTNQNRVSFPDSTIFVVVEQPAEPVGGMQALFAYIGQNIRYPKEARKKGITGKVYVSFVINQDGGISDVSVLKGIGHGCDEEVERLMKNAPPWRPGMQDGKPVRQRYVLPVSFNLGSLPKAVAEDSK